jgi:hypothetical protein
MSASQATVREFREIYRFEDGPDDGGVGWIAHPDEAEQRASHALQVDGDVWVIDPVDAPGLDDLFADLGEVVGVAILLDRHKRDAAAVARRHGVPIHLPDFMTGVAADMDAETTTYRRELGDTGYGAHEVVNNRFWKEVALYGEDNDVLVVPEAVGTIPFFRVGDERLGVHPGLRLRPPSKLARLEPERVLVGHGSGVHEDAADALASGIRGARRRAPRLYAKDLRLLLPF